MPAEQLGQCLGRQLGGPGLREAVRSHRISAGALTDLDPGAGYTVGPIASPVPPGPLPGYPGPHFTNRAQGSSLLLLLAPDRRGVRDIPWVPLAPPHPRGTPLRSSEEPVLRGVPWRPVPRGPLASHHGPHHNDPVATDHPLVDQGLQGAVALPGAPTSSSRTRWLAPDTQGSRSRSEHGPRGHRPADPTSHGGSPHAQLPPHRQTARVHRGWRADDTTACRRARAAKIAAGQDAQRQRLAVRALVRQPPGEAGTCADRRVASATSSARSARHCRRPPAAPPFPQPDGRRGAPVHSPFIRRQPILDLA